MEFSEIKAARKAETKSVKAALKAAGFDVRVGHGRGTVWGWLDVSVNNKGFTQGDNQRICEIARKASGREGRAAENISVNFMGAYDAPAVEVL